MRIFFLSMLVMFLAYIAVAIVVKDETIDDPHLSVIFKELKEHEAYLMILASYPVDPVSMRLEIKKDKIKKTPWSVYETFDGERISVFEQTPMRWKIKIKGLESKTTYCVRALGTVIVDTKRYSPEEIFTTP